jgi:hypothetical protein
MATKKETGKKDARPGAKAAPAEPPAKRAAAPKASQPAPKASQPAPKASQPAARAARVRAADADGASASEVAAEGRERNDVTDDQVARRAYELFVERGGEHGRDHEDWARAERELRGDRQAGPGRH